MSMLFQVDMNVLKQLLSLKFTNIRKVLFDKFINYYIWASCTMFVSGYLMQSFGLSEKFGVFQFAGIIASGAIFEIYGTAAKMVADFEHDQIIAYYLTLPTHTATVLCSNVLYNTIVGSVMAIFLLPLAKLILWSQLNFFAIAWTKFLFLLVLVNLVCSTASLLVAALIPSMDKFEMLWVRIIFPLWFLGGFQFSWDSVHAVAPKVSYFMLLNPIFYMTEGMRAVMLGQNGSINFWVCSLVLLITLIIMSIWSFKMLKKRLDFV
ncbi:ABC transporter permease [Candidatus Dependentiae bacterium]|nr:ABC transporter permease [Candidatus Dependentiae bacterium]MBU4386875.1 ABC transporter permease [Candidatus Dependentiae bacterium]MCG2756484.1 ABC transporter permease [Candidatus Dependentiae bacterium]